MIRCAVSPITGTTTPERGVTWEATVQVDNSRHRVTSRSNPARDMCRELVRLGIPDDAMQVYDQQGRLALTYASFHKAAERTLRESARQPIKLVRFQEYPSDAGP